MSDVVSESKVKRSVKMTFEALGIPVGSVLVFKNKPDVTCVTVDAVNLVEREGERLSISRLASKINGYPSSGYNYFMFEGVLLSRLRGLDGVDTPSEVKPSLAVGEPAVSEPAGEPSDGTPPAASEPPVGGEGSMEPSLPPVEDEFSTL